MNNDPNNQNTVENPVGRFMVAVGAAIELRYTGKILISQRSPNLDWRPSQWEIGYGRIAQFEDCEAGLRREVFEELGLQDLEIVDILRVWHIYRGSQKSENELIGITYKCRTNSEVIKISDEHVAYKWVEPKEALELITEEGIKADINQFINSLK